MARFIKCDECANVMNPTKREYIGIYERYNVTITISVQPEFDVCDECIKREIRELIYPSLPTPWESAPPANYDK